MTSTALEKTGQPFQLVTKEQVRQFFCPKATDKEVALFIKLCEIYQLNPFKREAYLVKYGEDPATMLTAYEVYLKRAERSNNWNGFKVWTEGKVPDLVAKIEIYRKDWDKPFCHEVDYSEYVGKKKDGTITKFWAGKPKTMLKKVAVSQGFRMAFPDELDGLPYTEDELDPENPLQAQEAAQEPPKQPLRKSATAHPESSTPEAQTVTEAAKPAENSSSPAPSHVPDDFEPPAVDGTQPDATEGDFKRITAKYKGMCKGCDGPIDPGQEIMYSKTRGNYHLGCVK